jgi:hypothetical protein
MPVELTAGEQDQMEVEVRAMMGRAQKTHCPDNKLGWGNNASGYRLTEFDIEHIGLIAEYAVVKQFDGGLKDCDVLTRGTGKLDDGIDITLPGHVTAQVKGVVMQPNWRRPYRPFWALRDLYVEKFITDIGILVLARCDGHAEILGYVTRNRFVRDCWTPGDRANCRIVDLGYGPRLGINALHMSPFEPLAAQLRQLSADQRVATIHDDGTIELAR